MQGSGNAQEEVDRLTAGEAAYFAKGDVSVAWPYTFFLVALSQVVPETEEGVGHLNAQNR